MSRPRILTLVLRTVFLCACLFLSAHIGVSVASGNAALDIDQLGAGDLLDIMRSGVSKFYITNDGKVGIATTTPAYDLSVAGDINFTGSLLQNGSPLAGSKWTTAGSDIYYTTGNVGVGTTSPYSKLSVAGQVVAQNYISTSTTATSTFAGPVLLRGSSTPAGYGTTSTNALLEVYGGSIEAKCTGESTPKRAVL